MTTSLPDFEAIEAHDNKVAAKAGVWARYGKLVLYFIMFAVAWGGWPNITQRYFDRLTWCLCAAWLASFGVRVLWLVYRPLADDLANRIAVRTVEAQRDAMVLSSLKHVLQRLDSGAEEI
jgi:hypothetical protein